VNGRRTRTGRYPNAGPLTLAQAGVRLIEAPAAPLFEELRDGDLVAIAGGDSLQRDGAGYCRVLDVAGLAEQLAEAEGRVDSASWTSTENTMTHLRERAPSSPWAEPPTDADEVPRPHVWIRVAPEHRHRDRPARDRPDRVRLLSRYGGSDARPSQDVAVAEPRPRPWEVQPTGRGGALLTQVSPFVFR